MTNMKIKLLPKIKHWLKKNLFGTTYINWIPGEASPPPLTGDMNREEAARVLTEFADECEKYELSENGWLETTYIPAHRMGAAALRGPQPDSETGLVPCGCGGVTEQTDFHDGFFPYSKVECLECGIEITRAGNIIADAHDEAKMAWNTAMNILEVEG